MFFSVMHVLLPVDTGEERAIAAAEAAASLPNASETVEVTILNVEKEIEVVNDASVESEDWYDEDDYPTSVKKAMTVLRHYNIAAKKRRAHGEPAKTIIKVANEITADRIIMTGRKKTPVGKVLFGSVTQSVLLSADTPVTVINT
jgi:nucleotide-binding universal stress UspA family protein